MITTVITVVPYTYESAGAAHIYISFQPVMSIQNDFDFLDTIAIRANDDDPMTTVTLCLNCGKRWEC